MLNAPASTRLIQTMLFGIEPLDRPTVGFVAIVLGITAALAVAGPAWRAPRIDPAVALRNQLVTEGLRPSDSPTASLARVESTTAGAWRSAAHS